MSLPETASADDELRYLQKRIRRLAEEKSYLQLVVRLIERINPLAGLHEMVQALLRDIVDTIGGTNIMIWYWIGDELHQASVLDEHQVVSEIADRTAAQVARDHAFLELRADPDSALLHDGALSDAWIWCFPLLVGSELVGVIKLENIHLSGASLRNYLPIFFSHAALLLSNEIRVVQRHEAQLALQAKTEELDRYFDNSLELICIADIDGYFRKLNPAWEKTLGYAPAALEGTRFIDLVHPDDLEATKHGLMALQEQQSVPSFVNRYRHQDGSWRWIEWHSQPKGRMIYAAARDITDKKLAEDAQRLAASVFANSQEGIVITDADNNIIETNAAFSEITGYARDDVVGNNPRILSSGRHDVAFYEAMWQSLNSTGNWRGEVWNRRKSGEVYAEMLCIDAVRDAGGQVLHYVGAFSDISQIKENQAALERIAHYDTLTGLPNRRLLADRLNHELARSRRNKRTLAICYLDLDGFKPVNDRFGHEAGDQLLIEIGRRLQSICREDDTVARLGGDEFVLLFSDLNQDQECFHALERVITIVAQPFSIGQDAVVVTASIGVTLYPRDDVDADTLMRHADQAMYKAKEDGKGRFHLFDAEHDRLIKANRETLQRLEEALTQNEFELFYQPKVDMARGKVIGAEALIRWRHPQRGLLAPAEFLPLLADTELEIAIGEWVIDTALRQLAHWQERLPTLIISVNVSAHQLLRADFIPMLKAALQRHPDVPPERIELEILESAAIDDIATAARTLASCIALGMHFALDDFGTGYSSLTYFRKLPVGTLKIDQGFVRNMTDDPEDLGIIESVIAMARAFNRPVIAEGVESVDHGAMLVILGCTLGQGYGIARPMPAADLPEWVGGWGGEAIWETLGRYALPPEDLVLIVASRAHDKWFAALREHLLRPQATLAPTLAPTQCPVGRWLYGSGVSRYGHLADYAAIDALHNQIHAQGANADSLLERENGVTPVPVIAELDRLHRQLQGCFGELISRIRQTATPAALKLTAEQAMLFPNDST